MNMVRHNYCRKPLCNSDNTCTIINYKEITIKSLAAIQILCCSIATNVLLYSSEPTYSAVELLSGVDKCTNIYERKSNKDILSVFG